MSWKCITNTFFKFVFCRYLLCWTILQLRVYWTSSSSTTRQMVSPSTSSDEAACKAPEGGCWGWSSTPYWQDKAEFVTPPVTTFSLHSRPIPICIPIFISILIISTKLLWDPKECSRRVFLSFSLSASVHFQHSAELIRLLSGSNLNYTLQVTAAISPFRSNKLRSRCVLYVNKCHFYTCVLVLHSKSPVDSFMTLTRHPFGVRVKG